VRRAQQQGNETAEHQPGEGSASVELGKGAQGPDQHQRDHQHLDLEHQLDGRPSWINQHGDARAAQIQDRADHATRQRRERPWPDRADLRWRQEHDDALDKGQ